MAPIRLPPVDNPEFSRRVRESITRNLYSISHVMTGKTEEQNAFECAVRYASASAVLCSCLTTLKLAGVDPDDIARLVAKCEQLADKYARITPEKKA